MDMRKYSDLNRRRHEVGLRSIEERHPAPANPGAHWKQPVHQSFEAVQQALSAIHAWQSRTPSTAEKILHKADLSAAIADAVGVLDLVAQTYGLDLSTIMVSRFNEISERRGDSVKFPVDGDQELEPDDEQDEDDMHRADVHFLPIHKLKTDEEKSRAELALEAFTDLVDDERVKSFILVVDADTPEGDSDHMHLYSSKVITLETIAITHAVASHAGAKIVAGQ